MAKLDKCPECGERIEASVVVYLCDVEIDIDNGNRIVNYDVQSEGIGVELRLYCANDHDLDETPDEVTLYGVTFQT